MDKTPPPVNASSLQLYLRLLGYTRKYWRVFGMSILALVVVAATEPAMPAMVKPILDRSFVDKDLAFMRWVPLMILGLFLVRGLASFVSDYAIQWTSHRVMADLRTQMFDSLVRMPASTYDNSTSGNLMSKFTYDVLQVTAAATGAITILVKDTLVIIGLLAFLLWSNWKLTLITLVVAPLIVLIVRRFADRLRRMSRAEQSAMGDLNHVLQESIDGQKVVKVFDGQDYEISRFRGAVETVRRYAMKANIAAAANVPLTQLAAAIAVAIIMYLVFEQAARNETTVGGFVAFLGAMLMLLSPLKRLTSVSQTLQRALAACESVFGLIDAHREVDTGTHTIARARGAIDFDNVRFNYVGAEREALKGLNLAITVGETIALVGSSGGGKTTMVNLLPRFYAPNSGRILIDGIDIATLSLASLRANIALVSQDVVLFNDTVAANIAYGRQSRATPAEIEAAARAAHAFDFIQSMPKGLDTVIGENGVRLSGGQRQRLAIARAFLKNAPILILDEATSALDSESERNVQVALEELMIGRTTIVIAHRLSTIERADRIVVMQDGAVVELGAHAELIAKGGVYARLHTIQYSHGGHVAAGVTTPSLAAPNATIS